MHDWVYTAKEIKLSSCIFGFTFSEADIFIWLSDQIRQVLSSCLKMLYLFCGLKQTHLLYILFMLPELHAALINIAQYFLAMKKLLVAFVFKSVWEMQNLEHDVEPRNPHSIKLGSDLAHLEVPRFKHFQLWTGPCYLFSSKRYQTRYQKDKMSLYWRLSWIIFTAAFPEFFWNSKKVWECAVLWFSKSI